MVDYRAYGAWQITGRSQWGLTDIVGFEAFPAAEARRLVERFEWHYTPKHGSWLPDLVQAVVERLSADGGASERGCRVTVKALLDQAGANAGGPARVHAYGHPTGAALPGRGVGEAELS